MLIRRPYGPGPVGTSAFDPDAQQRLAASSRGLGTSVSHGIERDSEALEAFFEQVTSIVPYQLATLALNDAHGHRLAFRASRAFEHGVIDGVRIPVARGIVGWVARHRQAVRLKRRLS
jgi:signal transduction protein with GAF and PtsI domain